MHMHTYTNSNTETSGQAVSQDADAHVRRMDAMGDNEEESATQAPVEDDDEELRRAIQASLQDQGQVNPFVPRGCSMPLHHSHVDLLCMYSMP